MENNNQFFGTERISKLLFKLAPPVMLAQLIQALYNIVDSYFIGQYSKEGLAALSVIFPIQLLISAFAIGTGVGVNALMSRYSGLEEKEKVSETAGTGTFLAIVTWLVFALVFYSIMGVYTKISLSAQESQQFACTYGRIINLFSIGIFLESNWSKVLQAEGDMRTPMIAQIAGALINILLDYLLIFGIGIFPVMGITGAAVATVIGQIIAAIIVGIKGYVKPPSFSKKKRYIKPIYRMGIPSILMNASCTIYIVGLNLILVAFSDNAVTVLGLYYKLQTFYLIPVQGLTTCIVPLISFNYAVQKLDRCKKILWESVAISAICMGIGTLLFELFPAQLLGIFVGSDTEILSIGVIAFRIIAVSFIPIAITVPVPTYFQAIGMGKQSIAIALLRQIVLLVPLAWIFSHFGLVYAWLTFPITEIVDASYALILLKESFNNERS